MNLGQPEKIYAFGLAIPFLAIIVAITTYVQSKVTMPATTTPGDQGAMMGKMMALYMPLLTRLLRPHLRFWSFRLLHHG